MTDGYGSEPGQWYVGENKPGGRGEWITVPGLGPDAEVTYLGPKMRHTASLYYTRPERLWFWLTGRWPRRVVERRLWAVDRDELEMFRKHIK